MNDDAPVHATDEIEGAAIIARRRDGERLARLKRTQKLHRWDLPQATIGPRRSNSGKYLIEDHDAWNNRLSRKMAGQSWVIRADCTTKLDLHRVIVSAAEMESDS